MHYVIKSRVSGAYWQTASKWISQDIRDATKYRDKTEATNARDFCCPTRSKAEVVEVSP